MVFGFGQPFKEQDNRWCFATEVRVAMIIERLASKLSCGTFASIPESGHYFWVEKPDEVKTSLRQFVCSQIMGQNP
jgi:pimeloyl-ACP methyl ester carboxylesterase